MSADEAVLYAAMNVEGRVVYSHESRENVEMNAGYIKTPTRVVGLAPIAPPVAAGSVDTLEVWSQLDGEISSADCAILIPALNAWGAQQRDDGYAAGRINAECSALASIVKMRQRAEKAEADLAQVNEWWAAALAENQAMGELWAAKVEKAEARMKELETALARIGPFNLTVD